VAWPSRRELFTFTVVVLITTTALTLIVFGFDVVFKILVLDLIRELG
jgi:preprotein translocase SecE subunit